MRLGKLIIERISNSVYCDYRAVYERMKEIVGDDCCDYKTFLNALNMNRGLSDKELYTLCILLDIDLNKEVVKYSKSKESIKRTEVKVGSDFEALKEEEILLFLNVYAQENHGCIGLFQSRDLYIKDNKILAVAAVEEWNLLAYCEVEVEKTKDGFKMRLKDILHLKNLKNILDTFAITLNEFYNSSKEARLYIAKREWELSSKHHPKEHVIIEERELKEFKKSFIDNLMLQSVEIMKDDMEDFDGIFYYYDANFFNSVAQNINQTCRDLNIEHQTMFGVDDYAYASNLLSELMKKEGFPSKNKKDSAV